MGWDEMGWDGMGEDGMGWLRVLSSHPAPSCPACLAHRLQQRKPFLFSPTSPVPWPGNAISRESPGSALLSSPLLSVLLPSLPVPAAVVPRGRMQCWHPLRRALPRQRDQGGRRGTCAIPAPNCVRGRTCFPKPTPDPTLPRPGGHHPLWGCSAGTVGASGLSWGFWDGVPQPYLRVRSLFQAWQLMGSSRKLW